MKKLLLILLLLPFIGLGQNTWVNYQVQYDFYAPAEAHFFMVSDANGDTAMFHQPTTPYEFLDTTIFINSGSYTVSLIDSFGDGWISNQPAFFKMRNLCQGLIINWDPVLGSFYLRDTTVNILPCAPPVYGCMDSNALNYDSLATIDDGSCTYPPCNGIINDTAWQMCWGSQAAISWEWETANNTNCAVIELHYGSANGYNITIPGFWPSGGWSNFAIGAGPGQMPPNWNEEHYMVLEFVDGTLSDTMFFTPYACIPGCTDPTQQSYNPWATIDDGSCAGTTCDTATEYQITMEITLDNWPNETSWIMNSGGIIDQAPQGTYNFNDIGQTFTYTFCVDQNIGFELILSDSYGDGLAGSTSGGSLDGNVVIYDCNGDTIWSLPDPNFGNVTYSGPQNGVPCNTTPDIYGCTDDDYVEYVDSANVDDGSCLTLHTYGCTDSAAFNYNPNATIMDLVPDCNYTLILEDDAGDGWGNSYLGVSQGQMLWNFTMGPGAYADTFNLILDSDQPVTIYYFEIGGPQTPPEEVQFQTWHNSFKLINANGIVLLEEGTNPFANNGQGALQEFGSPFWNTYSAVPYCGNYCIPTILGCMDSTAFNYADSANTDDGSCIPVILGCTNPLAFNYDAFANVDDSSCVTTIVGCMDSLAFNYNPFANVNDPASCVPVIYGCMDDTMFNYNPAANTPDTCIPVVFGCTDALAFNYDSLANTNNNSCIPFIYGCTNPAALNYDPLANTDDSTCIGVVYGCTDPTMWNYNQLANTDNGSCIPFIYGCTDSTMFNYDPLANTDNNTCIPFIYGCTNPIALNFDQNANTDDFSCILPIYGCMDSTAFNYDPLANIDNGSCVAVVLGCTNPIALNYNPNANTDDFSCILPIYGCTDSTMFNYDPLANVDNGTCIPYIYGCTNPVALNYDPNANTDDFSCILPIYGCTDSTMFNYNPLANVDNGSCIPFIYGCTNPNSINYNPMANTEDFSCIPFVYGCTDSTALNYDSLANTDNGSCITAVEGCMDANAFNYDAFANVNDSASCLYDAQCITGPGNPYWLNDLCYAWVIEVDDYCCNNAWDNICQLTYDHCNDNWSGPLPKRTDKNLIQVTDLLGRPVNKIKNQLLFYKYNDGSVNRKIIIKK